MSNDALNQYFENAIRDFAVQHFNEQLERAKEQEESAAQEYLSREIAWYEKQKDIVRQGDTLLINVGPAIWKIPVADEQFVRDMLPIFAKRLPDLEQPEAAELRKLQKSLRLNRWRLRPTQREALEKHIGEAEQRLTRAHSREPVQRFGIYKTISGRDVGVHRLYLRCEEDERAAAFDGDLTNFCHVPLRFSVERNFGFTKAQIDSPKFHEAMQQFEQRTVPNLYIVSSASNPSHERMQSDFERDSITVSTDDPDYIDGWKASVKPNSSTKAGTPNGVQDAGLYRQPTRKEIELGGMDSIDFLDRHRPASVSSRFRKAGEALDALLSGE